MTFRILIMGLPGSGKTTLANELKVQMELKGKSVLWLNADAIRKEYDDWDFSTEGRLRQSERMRSLSDNSSCDYTICDFVAPLVKMRELFDADYTVWMNTIESGRFEDTNKVFVPPDHCSIIVTTMDCEHWSQKILIDLE